MNAYWYCLISKVISISGFIVLVIFGYPWWGCVCLLLVASIDGDLKPPENVASQPSVEVSKKTGLYQSE